MPIIGCFPQGGGEPGATSGGKRICRYVVGSSTAGWTAEECDYLCDGTADEVEINAALAALPAGGGEVHLLDGSYSLAGSVNVSGGAVKLTGCGKNTVLNGVLGTLVNLFEPSCTSFHLDELSISITYDMPSTILITKGISLMNGTSAVEEFKMTGCEVDNLIDWYVKAPTTARFTMEGCRSTASAPPVVANTSMNCESIIRGCFFTHPIHLHTKSTVLGCSFDIPATVDDKAISVSAENTPCVIADNRIDAAQGIEGYGRGVITGNRITLKDGSVLRRGIGCWSGDLADGNMILREDGSSAFGSKEHTIEVYEEAVSVSVLGNVLSDKDVTDNGTGTVKANNVVLTTA